MARIRLITDSAADIPRALREEYEIQVLPFPIAVGDKEYRDGEDFTPQEFYDMLLSAPRIPTHAQLNPYLFEQCYRQAWQQGYTDVIYVSINSKGSATHQNALQAREEFFEEHPQLRDSFSIQVIDSRTYTMAYGYAVLEGAKLAASGAAAEEVARVIRDWTEHMRILFTPLDLRFAKKSGRVSAAAAFVGEALGLKPIMTFEQGASKVLTKVRGEKNVIPAMLELCQKGREPGTPYLLVRAGNGAAADQMAEAGARALGGPALMEYYIGGVIAINAGPNLVGILYRERED